MFDWISKHNMSALYSKSGLKHDQLSTPSKYSLSLPILSRFCFTLAVFRVAQVHKQFLYSIIKQLGIVGT